MAFSANIPEDGRIDILNISRVLIPTALQDRIAAYLDLLTRTLRNAARPVVLGHIRPLFKVFLEAFDVAKVPSGTNTDVSRYRVDFQQL